MWQESLQKWLDYEDLDLSLKRDLTGKTNAEREDMFYSSLAFGTGGMRGILGAGTNRMNIYTIRKANDGLARYLIGKYPEQDLVRGVVIAHDNRRMSREFAMESAMVLGAYGIKSYLFDALRPTPELSFATRYLHAISGIVITASHNPPQYNGYKIYDEFGCQYTPDYANQIVDLVNQTEDLFNIKTLSFAELESEGLIEFIGTAVDEAYLELVKTVQIHPEIKKDIKIVFTPLHGTSAMLATRLLSSTGYEFYPVKEQMIHDADFGTVKSPNPENPAAFAMAIDLGKKVDADLLIATDPDADRLGIAVKNAGEYQFLSGNQTGAILLYYLLNERKKLGTLPQKGVVFNTIVTSTIGEKIAKSFGFEVISTLTGFKFIGEQARFLEATDKKFIFGYEESFGYVINDGVRDKDALQALLLASEAASFYKYHENKTLYDVLLDIFAKYGYHSEALYNVELLGLAGKKRIDRIMEHLQKNHLKQIDSTKVVSIEDYNLRLRFVQARQETIDLPQSDVIKYILADGSWFVLRPSGTEPKLKIYAASEGCSLAESELKVKKIIDHLKRIVKKIA